MSKWISVDKQLPEKDGAYLCVVEYFSGPHIEIIDFATKLSDIDSYYFNGKHRKGWFEFDVDECTYWEVLTVTHWMPLPEPPEKQTNADRIRDMTDDELAKFLCDLRSCDTDAHPCNKCKAAPFCRPGHTGMIDWLQSPTNEG
ncbi:DUF551 domain-containing protein [Christensenellaceae bacterium NSJ-44]|uniref:DUF551 domain-containing protein n=1 Tax=Luoshenia tenuis TaxID=2763654 RepID=A0A926CYE8_9FIRM|nr:DUF551 domain-containing protein [Luoshenia tenuis]MBC8528249.1 DUF551 domain-containing protein [Luoshenia tenuis]